MQHIANKCFFGCTMLRNTYFVAFPFGYPKKNLKVGCQGSQKPEDFYGLTYRRCVAHNLLHDLRARRCGLHEGKWNPGKVKLMIPEVFLGNSVILPMLILKMVCPKTEVKLFSFKRHSYFKTYLVEVRNTLISQGLL